MSVTPTKKWIKKSTGLDLKGILSAYPSKMTRNGRLITCAEMLPDMT